MVLDAETLTFQASTLKIVARHGLWRYTTPYRPQRRKNSMSHAARDHEPDLIAVIRIPKCASTSLWRLSEAAWPDQQHFSIPSTFRPEMQVNRWEHWRMERARRRRSRSDYGTPRWEGVVARIKNEARDGDVLGGGHNDLRHLRQISTRLRPITVLRDPADRLMSVWAYGREGMARLPWLLRFDKAYSKKAALGDFDTFVSRLLEHRAAFENPFAQYLGIASQAEIAPRLKDDIWLAGVSEAFDAFRIALEERVGRKLPERKDNVTASRAPMAVSAATQRKIEALCALDYEIYEAVRSSV
ncbi:MAG: hypothetical protein AAGJ94_07805 [Pseudomonadota bacterium]